MIKRLVLVVLALAVVFGGIFGWKLYTLQKLQAKMAQPPPPATVAATEVERETWQPYLRAVGTMVATHGVHVNNEVAGQVSEIAFESGTRVERGEQLIELDDSVDRAELRGLVAERRLAELQHERIRRLRERNMSSAAELDQAEAGLERLEAQIEAKRALIRKKTVRAPFDGLLGIRQINLGEYLAPGARIVQLQALDPIHVDFSLPEREFRKIATGQKVLLDVDAYPGEVFEGEITALSPGIDTDTRNVRVRATLANPDGRLRPGMFAQVRARLPAREQVLTVPRTSISYNPYGDMVFVVEERDGQLIAQQRQVETGEVREGRVEITNGVEAGERVVKAGHQKLRNGQPVKIDNSVALDEPIKGHE
ncbi:MAG: efflux RND transporter periplasmic adaptor subunit [Gammaproteobacteria bacterium]|nr:efflux RND transporter periplasmic adaptor subunit [Gammaproteobacteria bacterium]